MQISGNRELLILAFCLGNDIIRKIYSTKAMEILVYQGPGERIDTRLTAQFPYTRNFFHHIIKRWGITIEKKPVKKSYKCKPWDQIAIDDLKRFMGSEVLAEAPAINLDIYHETDDYLVLYKPKWVLSHPNSVRDVQHPSVVGFLYHHYKELPSVGDFIRAWLLHRLDKETDGLMIIAKTEKALKHFKDLFQRKSQSATIQEKEAVSLQKYYRAICTKTTQSIDFLHQTSLPHIHTSMVIPQVPYSVPKQWITKIHSYNEQENYVILDIQILTGRTHQIRFHCRELWLPIIWDYLYGTDTQKEMWLTAYRLVFQDCDWERKDISLHQEILAKNLTKVLD